MESPSTAQVNYLCVARATDDDGNLPQIQHEFYFLQKTYVTVTKEKIYVKAGDYVD